MDVKDCSTWFLVEKQPKMTYPLPLGFQHTRYRGLVFLRHDRGIALAVRAVFMLKFQQHTLSLFCSNQLYSFSSEGFDGEGFEFASQVFQV
jgi:hypothetical protein